MKKINIALLGIGKISDSHLKALFKLNTKYNLVAICDNKKNIKNYLSKKTKFKFYNNVKDLFKYEKFDIISICTPTGLHFEHSIFALKNGVDIIVEKPITLNLKDAYKLHNFAKKNKRKIFVVKQLRYHPAVIFLKKSILKKIFGKIFLVTVNIYWNRSQKYFNSAKWRGTKKMDGGLFENQVSHYLDLLIWLFGPIKKVHAFSNKLMRKIETNDTGVANFEWSNGMLGSVNSTLLSYKNNYEGSLTIISENGNFKISGKALNKIENLESSSKLININRSKSINNKIIKFYKSFHEDFYLNVYKEINGFNMDVSDELDGIESLKLINAINKSSQLNKIIKL